MSNNKKYNNIWLAFVNMKAQDNFKFIDLIDFNGEDFNINYIGAWANILVKANSINEAIEIIPKGLNELNFKVVFIDKIENMDSLIEYDEINKEVKTEVNWLIESNFVFKISDKLFPYE